jgi:glycerophosphoryl diester phosphodiesterase
MVVIERDGGSGVNALFRRVNMIDLRDVDAQGSLVKRMAVDLTAIPDPDGISLPPIHQGDVGLGDPFRVVCESIEAVHLVGDHRLLLGCDNNFPNMGRNPTLADDNEFIVVKVPALKSAR